MLNCHQAGQPNLSIEHFLWREWDILWREWVC